MLFKDFQKHSAVQSLWDMDGQHISKRYRNKSRGRQADKKLIKEELALDITTDDYTDIINAIYCHVYGPCSECLKNKETI